jgi:hypothetical protein
VKALRLVPIVMLALTVSAAAEQRGSASGRRGNLSPGEIQRMFDGYVLTQVQTALGLSDEQSAQVVPRVKALQETRRQHQQERTRLLTELQRLTRSSRATESDHEPAIKERLARLQELDARYAEDLRRAYSALDEVLDVRQQARFRVFEEQIERKKLQLLLRARQNRQPPRREPGP